MDAWNLSKLFLKKKLFYTSLILFVFARTADVIRSILLLNNVNHFEISLANRNVQKVKGHASLKKGGCHEAHDIEDLVKVGKAVKGLLCCYMCRMCHVYTAMVTSH